MGSMFDLDVTQSLKPWTRNKLVLLKHKSVKSFSYLCNVLFTALACLDGTDATGREQGKLWLLVRVCSRHRKKMTPMTHMEKRSP